VASAVVLDVTPDPRDTRPGLELTLEFERGDAETLTTLVAAERGLAVVSANAAHDNTTVINSNEFLQRPATHFFKITSL